MKDETDFFNQTGCRRRLYLDPIGVWLAEACRLGVGLWTVGPVLFAAWAKWAGIRSGQSNPHAFIFAGSYKAFVADLRSRGFKMTRPDRDKPRGFAGVDLRPRADTLAQFCGMRRSPDLPDPQPICPLDGRPCDCREACQPGDLSGGLLEPPGQAQPVGRAVAALRGA